MFKPATLALVSRLYFLRDFTQAEIAARLGVSRSTVSRMLDQARADGVVRFEIDEPVAVDDRLSRALEDRFGLELALVVPEDELARAAALWLPQLLRDGDVLGVAWGETLSAVAEALAPEPRGTQVVQICGAVPGLERGAGPTEVALRFAERLGGTAATLPAPAVASAGALRELRDHEAVRPTLALFPRVTVALVGIGVPDDAAAHVLVHVLDGEGRPRGPRLPALALPFDALRRARTIAVAGGPAKRRAVLATLRSAVVDVLVTDPACARRALA